MCSSSAGQPHTEHCPTMGTGRWDRSEDTVGTDVAKYKKTELQEVALIICRLILLSQIPWNFNSNKFHYSIHCVLHTRSLFCGGIGRLLGIIMGVTCKNLW